MSALPDPSRTMPGRYHRHGPATEREAAAKVMPRSGTQRYAVLVELRLRGERGATDYELFAEAKIGARPHVPGTRREELIADGWPITDSGERRLTDTGARAIVWKLASLPDEPAREPGGPFTQAGSSGSDPERVTLPRGRVVAVPAPPLFELEPAMQAPEWS